ncbi:carbohydrate binding domain-containing protein [Paenibacillus roseipurpureus]|uniref:Carbohydrate binding domain-containing protein n=1 Tax=Paenibacillus roseopurpureus TaxID=2918901 RepID=A0AA96LRQ5_9BACL|nr:carbohydrate binding domain-containing protein [Paenibacillus sp. MBLB1832]WNR46004.1 carbohydrate binding domain-containing protein [Paenibacillus sp. MBLB1832]
MQSKHHLIFQINGGVIVMRFTWIKFASACVLMFALMIIFSVAQAYAADYYVNSNGGSNANNGLSSSSAWADFTNVNSTTFSPGDRILLARGGTWNTMLHPLGSGSSTSPIIIDAYGTGVAPLVNGNGATAGVYLYNQQYWEINNLEVINNVRSTGGKRRGIYLENVDAGTLNHIYIKNNNVHDIYGDNTSGNNGSAGIYLFVHGTAVQSKFNDVLIDNNTVGPAVDRTGINTYSTWSCRVETHCSSTPNWYPSTNLVISNNYLSDISGDGIVPNQTQGALIQYNTVNGFNIRSGAFCAGIWAFNADNTIIQYNEVSGGKTTNDAEGYDLDWGQVGTVIQYNYSHNNEGGFLLFCNCSYPSVNKNSIARYNISQNDQNHLINFSGSPDNLQIYNNTMYLNSTSTAKPMDGSAGGGGVATFKNNIFYLESAGIWSGLGSFGTLTFDYNTIYGVHTTGEPSDAHKLTTDPKLMGPGNGVSRTNLEGYKLMNSSPALGSGVLISNNGGKDYWGNPVSSTSAPNRGAYNGKGNVAVNPGFESGTLSPWTNWNTASVISSNVNSGSYALKLNGGPGSAEQIITVQPNTTYTLKGRGKVAVNGESFTIGAKNFGGTFISTPFTSLQYTENSVTFTTGATNTTATIYLYKATGAGAAYADDVTVTAIP